MSQMEIRPPPITLFDPVLADEPLYFLIRHIFLPPKLPCPNTKSTATGTTGEDELMKTVHDALTQFPAYLDAADTLVLDRCARMLKCMMDAHNGAHVRPDIDVLK